MFKKVALLTITVLLVRCATGQSQDPPNVSQVVIWSTLTNSQVMPVTTLNNHQFTPVNSQGQPVTGEISQGLLNIYTDMVDSAVVTTVNLPAHYNIPTSQAALSSVLSTNIAVALSTIPVESPASGVVVKWDKATGELLPVSSTLGPIFTKRAETIGKGKFFIGFTHQDYHFTSLDGHSLNGLSVLFQGGEPSAIMHSGQNATTSMATFNLALDVRVSQDVTFLTYGVTNHFDVSVGLPVVHAGVASTAYNGIIYSGTGTDFNNGDKCWCVDTFTPGTYDLTKPYIGQANLAKTGFGDMLLRFKGVAIERPNAVVAVGMDLRLPTGDAANYLGIGTTAVRPFAVVSLYSKPLKNKIVFAPHADLGWQFSGQSILGGTLQGAPRSATLSDGTTTVPYFGTAFTTTKGDLPDIFSWAVGTEVALGRHNTVIADILGNQIGWVHGVPRLESLDVSGPAPLGVGSPANTTAAPSVTGAQQAMANGLAGYGPNDVPFGRGSFGQYSGAFGYKVRVYGNLIFTAQALVRFDNNGLTARVSPLYGLSYSFGAPAKVSRGGP